jgi:hypothetical protein
VELPDRVGVRWTDGSPNQPVAGRGDDPRLPRQPAGRFADLLDQERQRRVEVRCFGDLPGEPIEQEQTPLRLEPLVLDRFSLVSVPDRVGQRFGFERRLRQVVLCTDSQGRHVESFIVQAREDDDRHVSRSTDYLGDGLQPLRIGQREVEEDDIVLLLGQLLPGRDEPVDVIGLEPEGWVLAQELQRQARVRRVVLDEENPERDVAHGRAGGQGAATRALAVPARERSEPDR